MVWRTAEKILAYMFSASHLGKYRDIYGYDIEKKDSKQNEKVSKFTFY